MDGKSAKERLAEGKAMREKVPRSSHSGWKTPAHERDPVELLIKSSAASDPDLLPYRWDRMKASPFAFLRGSAALMAADLSTIPKTGFQVQACGDGHLLNFGVFATPERALIFDVNDFDETHPGPWEWDVKRLAASAAVAALFRSLSAKQAEEAARRTVTAYRQRIRELALAPALQTWYSRVLAAGLSQPLQRMFSRDASADPATSQHPMPGWVKIEGGTPVITDRPPLIFHPPARDPFHKDIRALFELYRRSLPDERRLLLARFRLLDFAMKVVGVGSVGTRSAVALLLDETGSPLFLQIKEANASVLEPYTSKSLYKNHGQRVVTGQRILQSASDMFLGWSSAEGRDFYVRQLRDRKAGVSIESMNASLLISYAELCGRTLARAHARGGDIVPISGYLGAAEAFDEAVAKFSIRYAKQTEKDHATLLRALRTGRLPRVPRARAAAK